MQNLERRLLVLEGSRPTGLEALTDEELDARIAQWLARIEAAGHIGDGHGDELDANIAVHRARYEADKQCLAGRKEHTHGNH